MIQTGDAEVTNPAILTAKTIASLLENADLDDAKDAELAIKLIRAMLVPESAKQS